MFAFVTRVIINWKHASEYKYTKKLFIFVHEGHIEQYLRQTVDIDKLSKFSFYLMDK